MSLPRLELSTQISDRLNFLSAMLKARTRNGLNDASHTLEHIVARLFNALFGWKLENLNTEKSNYPGLDLADRERGIAVQVTNNGDSQKIKDTFATVNRHGLDSDFSKLILFFLLPQKPSTPRSVTALNAGFDVEIWDIADLLKKVGAGGLEQLRSAAAVLAEEIGIDVESINVPTQKIANNEPAPAPPILVAKFQE